MRRAASQQWLVFVLFLFVLSLVCPVLPTTLASLPSPAPSHSHADSDPDPTAPRGRILRPDDELTPSSSPSSPPCDGFGSLTAWKAEWGEEDVTAPLHERQLSRLHAFSRLPLKGWNSCGAFFWSVGEEEMMANINATIRMLLPSGYNIIELDWYTAAQHLTPPALSSPPLSHSSRSTML